MTLAATVQASIDATKTTQQGLTTAVNVERASFTIQAGDCSKTYSASPVFSGLGFHDILLANVGFASVKLLYIKNNSNAHSIAMTAGWNGTDFRNFVIDYQSWNFAPMVNLGSLTLRGYPIRPKGVFLLSCPNSDGFSTASGGDILRIGGVSGQSFEIYIMGN